MMRRWPVYVCSTLAALFATSWVFGQTHTFSSMFDQDTIVTDGVTFIASAPRSPSTGQKQALVGTSGTPSSSNKFVTDADSRMSSASTAVQPARSISTTAPLAGGGDLSANRTLSIPAATSSVNGYLSSTDWSTFNGKVSAARAINTTAPITGGGDLSADRTIACSASSTSASGCVQLSSSTSSTSTVLAATASAVKTAYDLASSAETDAAAAQSTANNALPLAGGTMTGREVFYAVTGITASTTQTQGQGALTGQINQISTVANTNDTVTLPTAAAGARVLILNDGAHTLKIFPASGADLGQGTNTATTLAAGSAVEFAGYSSTKWDSASSSGGAVSSVFGRTGAVTAQTGDYTAAQITNAVATTRTISTTAPLTGGGDLSADRTIAIPKATSSVDGYLFSTDWTTFNNKVSTSRSISAGTGLTGGGDLSADRTLTVAYGTSSSTACVGNDSRLSDSRAPSGSAGGDLTGTYPSPSVVAGSTSTAGKLQLTDSTSSTSTTTAATPNSVKSAYDLASTASSTANAALPLAGGTMTGRELFYETTGITAGTTQTQAGATALTCQICRVATVGTNGDGVRLPTAAVGERILILNQGAHSLAVYPATSGAIAGGSTNASITIEAGGAREFSGAGTTAWDYANPLGSTTVVGPVQLTDSISSTLTTTAATPNSVKTAYDQTSASGVYNGFTSKSTPVGADILAIEDSAASNAKKKTTFTNVLASFAPDAFSAAVTDITTNNATSGHHGFIPKCTGAGTLFWNDTCGWSAPSGSGGSSIWNADVPPASASAKDDEFPNGSVTGWSTWDVGTVLSSAIVNNHLELTSNAGGVKWAGLYKTVPSSEFACYAKVGVDCLINEIVDAAMFVSEDVATSGSTADFISAEVFSSTSNAHGWITRRWSAYNGTASGASTTESDAAIHGIYVRMRVNGSSVSSDFSNDGESWFTLQTVTFSGTPADVGLTILSQTAAVTRHTTFEFFRCFSGAGTSGKDATSIGGLL